MAGSAREWKDRYIGAPLRKHGVTLDALEVDVVRNPMAPPVLFEDMAFPTETGKVNLMTEAEAQPEPPDPDYPLFMMSLSTKNSQSSQWARPPEGLISVTVHPDAAQGIPHGEQARMESRIVTMDIVVHHDSKQRSDVAIIPKGGHLSKGHCANALIRARTTDLGEGGALYDERVRLVPWSDVKAS